MAGKIKNVKMTKIQISDYVTDDPGNFDDINDEDLNCLLSLLEDSEFGLLRNVINTDDSVEVSIDKHQTDYNDTKIGCFLRLNADATKLIVWFPNKRFLKQASEDLTNLETLYLMQQVKDEL